MVDMSSLLDSLRVKLGWKFNFDAVFNKNETQYSFHEQVSTFAELFAATEKLKTQLNDVNPDTVLITLRGVRDEV